MNRNDRSRYSTGLAETLPRMNETNQGSKSTEVSSIPSRVTTPNDSSHRTAEAHRFIQNELEQNDGMTKDRQNVLTSALDFVARFSHPSLPQPNLNVLDTEEDLVSGSTPPELLYMMLPGKHWPMQYQDIAY